MTDKEKKAVVEKPQVKEKEKQEKEKTAPCGCGCWPPAKGQKKQ